MSPAHWTPPPRFAGLEPLIELARAGMATATPDTLAVLDRVSATARDQLDDRGVGVDRPAELFAALAGLELARTELATALNAIGVNAEGRAIVDGVLMSVVAGVVSLLDNGA